MRPLKSERITIGVLAGWQVFAGTLDSFLDHVFHGIQAAAQDFECNLLLACGIGSSRGISLGRPAWPFFLDEVDFIPIGPWNSNGLIIIPPLANQAGAPHFEKLISSGFPAIYAGDRISGPAVVVDNERGIHQALRHLFDHGHRRIAFIAGRKASLKGDSGLRLRAYVSGIQSLGLDFTPELIVFGSHTTPGGRQATQEILSRGAPFTAILASNDESAIGAIEAVREAGLRVPQDIAVIGFDDRIEARAQMPLLTTVHFPMFELGYQSVEFLIKRLRGEVDRDTLTRIPTRLVIRETCGCPPGSTGYLVSAPGKRGLETSGSGHLWRQQIIHALALAAYQESQRLSFREVSNLCQLLVEAFQNGLLRGDALPFHQAIQQILARVSSQGDDLYAWQGTMTVLRNNLAAFVEETPSALSDQEIEDMFHQARVEISEVSRGQTSRLLVRLALAADYVGQLTSRFFTAKETGEIFAALEERLPNVGIQNVAAALYQAEGDDPVAWSVLQAPRILAENQPRFPTRQFPPEGLYPANQPFNLALLPIRETDKATGFVAFETSNLEVCALIVQQLVAALKAVHLYQEAVEARQLAEEANRLKGRFLSIVSHELRMPLNLISGLSDMLLRGSARIGSGEYRVSRFDLERIFVGAQHLDSLIRDVLDLAQSDMGQLKLDRRPLEISEVLSGVAVVGEQLAHDKGLAWSSAVSPGLPKVWGDRTRLRQVTLNLINNAVKFTNQGEISLTAIGENGKVIITVSDTGLGIPLDEQAVIFDEFRQSERTTARGYGGLGLGLAICKRLVEMHGGEIGVCSSGEEGQGSTFTLTLPALEPQTSAWEVEDYLTRADQVLLLVKEISGAHILSDYLIQRGFKIAIEPIEARTDWLSRMLINPPSAIVLDLGLTAERGWDILKLLKENKAVQNIPVFFFAQAAKTDRAALLQIDYLTKPLGSAVLTEALSAYGLSSASDETSAEKRILVVDDEPGILELHSQILEAQSPHYRVLQAKNGKEALEMVRRQLPDLVLLDLMMPEMDGFAVLEAMHQDEAFSRIPVIVVTGQALTMEDMARLNTGVASVLSKGMFSVEETLEHVAETLTHRRRLGSETQRIVQKAMAYIHEHYAESITRNDMAVHVGLSERHLTRCFHQQVGITPITYLNRFRIKQAKALLESGNKGITEVSLEVGFSTSGYFARVFRDEVGVSPRDYQRSRCG